MADLLGIPATRDVTGAPGRLIYLMGPSGAGKDSLIDASREPLRRLGCEVVRRVITRSAESVGEDAAGVSQAEFERLCEQGGFALHWHANSLDYGIPVQIDQWLDSGRHVLVNGSREHLPEARKRYPNVLPVLLTVQSEVLRQRLVRRGRESADEIEARLRRNELFLASGSLGDASAVLRLDNSEELSVTVEHFLGLLEQQGISVKPDRT
ncbi:phosphonate metabolism protein/1,5-bisphosphokinase (PRPP-forming) PhnN [Pseudomonas fluorescens]|uniref:Ribose 1,5-bisphosphate phosphokinase PhnN n=1 Tax=Pseudomonas fluorescens TaxID=294 RepID=A0A5E7E3N9_PSEFL|nr:phosphonate metabolism protein/1,5-bisphosphokinase (PRPP-forming) PhnN [Pseudomonas fluorescens]VVO18892.1 Ribose 1,5-bisphosphate phosphokinase PhnN [Pseudomonas fluorescens]